MRFTFNFRAEKLPIWWRNSFLSFVKKVLSEGGVPLWYLESEKPKPFTFALVVRNPRIKNNEVYFTGTPKFIFSTSDVEMAIRYYNGFVKLIENGSKDIEIGLLAPIRLELSNFRMDFRKIISSCVIVKTLSPICVKDKDGKPVLPSNSEGDNIVKDDEKFSQALAYSLELIAGRKPYIRFGNFIGRKVVVQHFPSEDSKERGKPVKFVCWEGRFKVEGHPEDIKLLYLAGVGFRRSQGFGCVDIVKELR